MEETETETDGAPSTGQRRGGWTSAGLEEVDAADPRYWTTAQAAALLGPPDVSAEQMRQLIRMMGLRPAGKRRVPGRGRHVRVYEASELIKIFDALCVEGH